MKMTLAAIAVVLLCGCGSVKAQNGGSVIQPSWETSGKLSCPKGRHIEIAPSEIMACVLDDGKPPRWVPAICAQPNKNGILQSYPCAEPPIAHWECDKGYEPDGLETTWPGGVFTPKPARCKAKP